MRRHHNGPCPWGCGHEAGSPDCQAHHLEEEQWWDTMSDRHCAWCGDECDPQDAYCSLGCEEQAREERR